MKRYNFGRKHWTIIIICFFLFLLTNACTSDGENVILPKLAAFHGWDYSRMLVLATAAGCLSIFGSLIIGRICEKKGAKFTIILGLFLSAGFVFLYGAAPTMWAYAIGLFGAICAGQGISYFGANALIANWFPLKKGLAMGIVSVGPPVSTIIMVSVLTFLINSFGLIPGVLTISAVLIVMAVICGLVIRDTPEMCGETPDNMPKEELEQFAVQEERTQSLKLADLVKIREFWFIIIIIGVCSLSQTGVMAQFIVRYTDSGFAESTAILMMSVCAAVGIFGSVLVGYVENRLGTKKAYAVFAVVFAAALILNFTNIRALMAVSIPMFGCVITLLQIFLPSFEITVFGRKNFKAANGIIFPIVSMAGQLTFLLISVCLRVFGQVRYAYPVFAGLLLVTLIFNAGMPKEEQR